MTERVAYYFGPVDRPGHCFHVSDGRMLKWDAEKSLPWSAIECDGNLQLGTAELKKQYPGQRPGKQPEGICLVHHRDGWTALAFWDRSCDSRMNSSSTIMIEQPGLGFDQMVAVFRVGFPQVYARATSRFDLHEHAP